MKATYSQFAGIRNTVPPQHLGGEDLAAAVNVDVTDARRLKRRDGITQLTGVAADSLFRHRDVALFRQANALRRLAADGTSTEIATGIANAITYWGAADGRIFWSDTVQNGIVEHGVNGPWGVAGPSAQPAFAAVASGFLPRGHYRYAMTYLRDGLESGTGASIETGEIQGGIEFSSIEVPSDVDAKLIYLTRPNGEELSLAMTLAPSATQATYTGDTTLLGAGLDTQFKQPPPAGAALAEHNGRMLVALGEYVLYSPPYRADLFDPHRMNLRFDAAVRLLAPVEGGVFVGTDASIEYLSGEDFAAASRTRKAGYGVIPGTLDYTESHHVSDAPGDEVALIGTQEGIAVLGDGGYFVNLTLDRYRHPKARAGAGVVRLQDGRNRYIAVLRGLQT